MSAVTFAQLYERFLVAPLFRPWAELVLDELAPAPHERLLDIACGSGVVARIASERGLAASRIVGVDTSADMLAVARAAAPGIEWRQGEAAALPSVDAQFDIAVCHQGLQFFADKAAAVREMQRVLVDGGRLAVSVWRDAEETPLVRELQQVAERRLGPLVDRRHAFGDVAALGSLLHAAGLREIRVERATRRIRFADGAAFLRMNTMALVGMSDAGKALPAEERARLAARIVKDSETVLAHHAEGDALSFELTANVATARR